MRTLPFLWHLNTLPFQGPFLSIVPARINCQLITTCLASPAWMMIFRVKSTPPPLELDSHYVENWWVCVREKWLYLSIYLSKHLLVSWLSSSQSDTWTRGVIYRAFKWWTLLPEAIRNVFLCSALVKVHLVYLLVEAVALNHVVYMKYRCSCNDRYCCCSIVLLKHNLTKMATMESPIVLESPTWSLIANL